MMDLEKSRAMSGVLLFFFRSDRHYLFFGVLRAVKEARMLRSPARTIVGEISCEVLAKDHYASEAFFSGHC